MKFNILSTYLQQVESTAPRLKKTNILSQLFSDLYKENDEKQIMLSCYLMQGRLVPRYESLEFQLSVKMVLRSVARVLSRVDLETQKSSEKSQRETASALNLFDEIDYGQFEKIVQQRYKTLGDVGLVIETVVGGGEQLVVNFSKDSSKELSILEVHEWLSEIAKLEGEGSQDKKVAQLEQLFMSLDSISAKFVARIIIGKLRLGFSTMTILDALSWTKLGDKTDAKMLEDMYQKKADIGKIAVGYLLHNATLVDTSVEVGIPVVPALCQRLNSAQEIIEKMSTVLVEPKYDGLRIQIHLSSVNGKTFARAYTRNLEEVTHMFPELNQAFSQMKCRSCILDAEAIGYNPKTGSLLPFQETITRKRKHGVAAQAEEVPIRFYVFDVMFVNDESLLDTPLNKRKSKLKEIILLDESKKNQPLQITEYMETTDPIVLREYHEKQLGDGLEGAVIKKTDSKYRSGRKGWRWVKIKEEEGTQGKLSDTLDCVVMGYYAGRGKRTSFGIGAFLVGVLESGSRASGEDTSNSGVSDNSGDDAEFLVKTIAKIGTGLTDEQLAEIKQLADDQKTNQKPLFYLVDKNLYPDVWIEPSIVVEIAADEITRSPIHSAGKALRFPRLLKIRDDKSWNQATTVEELESIG